MKTTVVDYTKRVITMKELGAVGIQHIEADIIERLRDGRNVVLIRDGLYEGYVFVDNCYIHAAFWATLH
jgi:hypothetical protein